VGNVISHGNLVQLSGLENANFGITKDGRFVTGYLAQNEVADGDNHFSELISGMLWLVRDGKKYYSQSYAIERPTAWFLRQHAPRTFLGHDQDGRLYIFVVRSLCKIKKENKV
jgi:N-acetylglucosamine-1-phosphodiester alpha-N-acetylglucosaminidase